MHSVTILMPVRIDNQDRIDNFQTCLRYLTTHFPHSEILVVEDDAESQCDAICRKYNVTYHHRKNSGRFSRSMVINTGLLLASNDYFVVYDIDVLIDASLISRAVKIIERSSLHIVLPHNSIFINVKGTLKARVSETLDIGIVPPVYSLFPPRKRAKMEAYCILSGVVIFRTSTLKEIGGYSKKMISYGWEDIEVLKRAAKLGFYYFSLPTGNVIHLDHARGKDSTQGEFYELNKREFLKISSMNVNELVSYINHDLKFEECSDLSLKRIQSLTRFNRFHLVRLRFILNRFLIKLIAFKR